MNMILLLLLFYSPTTKMCMNSALQNCQLWKHNPAVSVNSENVFKRDIQIRDYRCMWTNCFFWNFNYLDNIIKYIVIPQTKNKHIILAAFESEHIWFELWVSNVRYVFASLFTRPNTIWSCEYICKNISCVAVSVSPLFAWWKILSGQSHYRWTWIDTSHLTT